MLVREKGSCVRVKQKTNRRLHLQSSIANSVFDSLSFVMLNQVVELLRRIRYVLVNEA